MALLAAHPAKRKPLISREAGPFTIVPHDRTPGLSRRARHAFATRFRLFGPRGRPPGGRPSARNARAGAVWEAAAGWGRRGGRRLVGSAGGPAQARSGGPRPSAH